MKKKPRSKSGKMKKTPKRFSSSGSSSQKKRQGAVVAKKIEEALPLHRMGQVDKAELIYREVLEIDASNVDALHLLGLIEVNRGNNEEGLILVKKALKVVNDFPQIYNTLGIAYRNLGRYEESEKAFKSALNLEPSHEEASVGLTVSYRINGKLDLAKAVCEDALKRNPKHVQMLVEYGTLLQQQKDYSQAEEQFKKVLLLNAENTAALNNLGVMNIELGRHERAIEYIKRIFEHEPDYAFGWNNLGLAYDKLSRYDESLKAYERAIEISPDYIDARFNLGRLNIVLGRKELGKEIIRKIVEDFPSSHMALAELGDISMNSQDFEGAAELFSRSIQAPSSDQEKFSSFNKLSVAYRNLQRFDEAELAVRDAIAISPSDSEPYNTLGWILHDVGKHSEAEAAFREGLSIDPDSVKIHSNLLFLLTYQMNLSHERQLEEHLVFSRDHKPVDEESLIPSRNDFSPYRKLRVGYVSPDFKKHVVRFFIQPVLEYHDRSRVEVYCYAEVEKPDEITEMIKGQVDNWYSTWQKSDLDVANQIRKDEIDILIDLAGHSGCNRLGVFMYDPAPVQVSYLGYIATTGIPQIKYRITDNIMNPEDTKELYSEELYRLDRCYKCYAPDPSDPDVSMHVSQPDEVIFGSLNRISKLPKSTIKLWSEVLKAVPGSRLLLARHELKFEENRQQIKSLFEEFDILEDRLILDDTHGYGFHMEIYGKIDIALDPIPVSGGATTCEALWMGVPVLTLQGEAFRGRITSTLLTAIGLSDWVTTNEDDYIEKAVRFSKDFEYRLSLRKKQRDMMRNSELGDALSLAKSLEEAYIDMWNRHLASLS